MFRRSGGSVFCGEETTRSPTRISPSVGSTKPARSRSVVVLPQPDGPSRQTSVPCSIVMDTLSTTACGPYFFVNPRGSTDATGNPLQSIQQQYRDLDRHSGARRARTRNPEPYAKP